MNKQDILNMIQERIQGVEYTEQLGSQEYFSAKDEVGREIAVRLLQIGTSQRLVLQSLFDEIQSYEED